MVLFYCTFVALKARNLLTVQIRPNEFQLHREKRLFQALDRIRYVSHSTSSAPSAWTSVHLLLFSLGN
ncbi:hypothetical protein NEMBOFW57_002355 [Staphylotrichum longicolle]|uniref:Uncharacterized protein n=1 Tax=Staphylotrichum longicolle TaxID=669026 RepID=A0AAD4I3J4_9PEZI|nr:hypothetical protein NEMBOFW57_002355 [Staphylotrichum longicolle]